MDHYFRMAPRLDLLQKLSNELVWAWEISRKAKPKISSYQACVIGIFNMTPLQTQLGIAQEIAKLDSPEDFASREHPLRQNYFRLLHGFLRFEQIFQYYRDPLKIVVQ